MDDRNDLCTTSNPYYCCSDFDECDANSNICSEVDNLANTHCVDSSQIADWSPEGMRYKTSGVAMLHCIKLTRM